MHRIFKYNDKTINSSDGTILCGIVNVTPDSFSDGGRWYSSEKAVAHALDLIKQGAGMLDIGGESTRPGSTPVDAQEEIDRIVPVIRELKKCTDVPLSIDTWKASVAKAAIEVGADIINDITGFIGDPDMAKVVGKSRAGAILMFNPVIARPDHPGSKIFPCFGGQGVFSQEEIKRMSTLPIQESMRFYLKRCIQIAHKGGVDDERIMLDPGIGFGLTKKENLLLIKDLHVLRDMGYCTFVGVSRKRFIVNILENAGFNMDPETEDGQENRDLGSAALTAISTMLGADVIRVHTISHHRMPSEIGNAVRFSEAIEDVHLKQYSAKNNQQ
ncbi:MAG: dihydropteroate synthase [Lentisphaerae bacterium]|nr:dihydropteroate synthase [Lentisphaerota bacterium]OQC11582.1 MAG: Dihydropteroate synthase [Lentisphaerae bacterium ADurb.Bin082]HQL87275.1 dihydropteroate synthase [Lentisphaeria bacterium]